MLFDFLAITLLMHYGETSRILAFYPSPSISHHVVFRPITRELLKHGHEMVVVTPFPEYSEETRPQNLKEVNINAIAVEAHRKSEIFPKQLTGNKKSTYEVVRRTISMVTKIMKQYLLSESFQEMLQDKNEKFDLILCEGYVYPAISLTHVYKAPLMFISSLGPLKFNTELAGTYEHPIYHPHSLSQVLVNHSLVERGQEFFHFHRIPLYDVEEIDELMRDAFGASSPNVAELTRDMEDMLFLNVHSVWDANRPVASNVVRMGGLQLQPHKDLPKDLQDYLDSSKTGVIYVSFGTSVDAATLDPDRLKLLVEVFSKVPYDVLWKWNHDELPGRGSNIRISKWLPQADVLRHPKVKLIVFQGGLQSTDEAIEAGVPMLSIPLITDQWYNSQLMMRQGIGQQVDLETVTEAQLTGYVHMLIDDESYKANVEKLRAIKQDQPQSALTRTVWWIEHVLRHGSRHLRAPAANMTWTAYFEVELLALIIIGSLTSMVVCACMARCVWKAILRKCICN